MNVSSEIIIFKPRLDFFTAKFHLMFSVLVEFLQLSSLPRQLIPEMFSINSYLTVSLVTDIKNYRVFQFLSRTSRSASRLFI